MEQNDIDCMIASIRNLAKIWKCTEQEAAQAVNEMRISLGLDKFDY